MTAVALILLYAPPGEPEDLENQVVLWVVLAGIVVGLILWPLFSRDIKRAGRDEEEEEREDDDPAP